MITVKARIFVATKTVDFRGSFDRLGGIVRERLSEDPRAGAFFVFFNRAGNRIKILFADQTGDCIFYKRLDACTYRGIIDLDPEKESIEIDGRQLRDLIAGIPKTRRRQRLH